MKKHWQILEPEAKSVEEIRKILQCTYFMAAVLVNRDIVSKADALNFFNLSLSALKAPFSIKDMDKAVERISCAILNNEKILIFGDYDVDGITSTTLILEFLQYTGANVCFYIPHRTKEGYDIQTNHIFGYALANEIDLIITVDCGSSRYDAVQAAQNSGIDVIITDHHNISQIPPAIAVVNPRRSDCNAGFEHLAGVGVAFALVISLRKYLRDMNFWHHIKEPNLKKFCDLVALGTIADMVPLVAENRILSRIGIDIINDSLRPGLNELVKASGIIKHKVNADDIAFKLAPRINAAGRMAHADKGVELLTTKNPETAREIALSLTHMNRKRQETEKKIIEQILLDIAKNPDILNKNTLILFHHNWHEGVLGIVASRLAEKFFKPVILISTKNNTGKGSGRSIPGIDIYDGLVKCSKYLEKFGGHPMAAGLQIKSENINDFQKDFNLVISERFTDKTPVKTIPIDYELNFNEISNQLLDELESMRPFGTGNPEPVFMAKNVQVSSSKIIGKHHRKMVLRQNNDKSGRQVNAIQFNIDKNQIKNSFNQIAFSLAWNRWNGKKTQQIIIQETY